MKAPNGYGAVFKLSGKRRKPWTVRITVGYKPNEAGSLTPEVKYLGYYKSRAEAFTARDRYNQSKSKQASPTFGEVLDEWSGKHFPTLTAGSIDQYEAAIKRMEPLRKAEIADLSFVCLQDYIDALPKEGQRKRARSVFKQVFGYAVKLEYVEKNVAVGLDIGKTVKSTKHFKYSREDVTVLWEHKGELVADFVLITIYSGMRPGELQQMKNEDIDLEQGVFIIKKGKTENARRNIPIHPEILPIVKARMSSSQYLMPEAVNRSSFHSKHFKQALEEYGILEYTHPSTHEVQHHLPHDGRHTFASRWKALQLDESMRRYIQGHAGEGIGEQVYVHYGPSELKAEIEKLWF